MASPRTSVTTLVAASERPDGLSSAEHITTLVIVWSAAEPARIGEVAVLASNGMSSMLGRGEGDDADEPRLRFFRQRPSVLAPTEPFASPGLSRRQLLVHPLDDGATVERVGQCGLEINGERCDAGNVRHGDVIHLRNELVLLCVRRPAFMPPLRLFPSAAIPPFGSPDAFGILGESPLSWQLRESIAFAAKAATHVLVLGESGTGKELAARAVHALSVRSKKAFLARNAATLPAGLVDAELFGNAKNYPNPGMPERAGLIGEADGGTLFLDEIGELPSELQAHLLRALDSDGEYQRLGEAQTRRSSFRLVAATNRDPSALKHDFLARFTAQIELPNLDLRREDVPLLLAHLLVRAKKRSPEVAGRFTRFDPHLVIHVVRQPLPGNVRELDSLLWKGMAESANETITLPRHLRERRDVSDAGPVERPEPTLQEIHDALAAQGNSVPKAAKALGLSSRYALYRLMKKHEISEP